MLLQAKKTGAGPGFEKGEGAGDFVAQFRGLFKEVGAKRGGRAPPPPPSGSAPEKCY